MRPIVAVSIGLIAVLGALPVGYVWFGARTAAKAEAQALREAPGRDAAALAGRLAERASDLLTQLAAREGERPWFHWQHFIADPRGVYDGEALVPSPLASGPTEALIFGHVQIDEAGRVTTPEVFEGEGEVSGEARARSDELEAVLAQVPELVAPVIAAVEKEPLRAEAAAPEPDVQLPVQVQMQAPAKVAMGKTSAIKNIENQDEWVQVQQLDNSFYQQNKNVADVYEQIKGKRARVGTTKGEVILRIGGFAWNPVTVRDTPALLALRAVETPDGTRRQGFAVTRAALEAELKKVEPSATLAEKSGPDSVAVPMALPVEGPEVSGWRVRIPIERSRTEAQAEALEAGATLTAILTTLAALLVAGLVIAVLLQSERLLARRQRFAAAAAHELRTPLAGLRMYAEMLAHGLGKPEKQRLYAERLVSESARLGRVVSNVLDFTRLEKKSLVLNPRPGDVVPFLRELVAQLGPTLSAAGASLELELPQIESREDVAGGPRDTTLYARFDPDALTQVLMNLVDNAEKYTRDAADRTIALAARRVGEFVEISVRDFGPGLPGRATRLFSAFKRGVGRDGPAGLGLGLALGRSLTRAQGGELRAVEVQPGAELIVRLLAAPAT